MKHMVSRKPKDYNRTEDANSLSPSVACNHPTSVSAAHSSVLAACSRQFSHAFEAASSLPAPSSHHARCISQ